MWRSSSDLDYSIGVKLTFWADFCILICMDTIFSKIVTHEIPATIIYEDEESMAFLDINPVTHGHTLLITKVPYTWMKDVPDDLLGRMFIRAKKLMKVIGEGLDADFVQISVVGKDIPHFHIHIIPRYDKDEFPPTPTTIYLSERDKREVADKIIARMK